MNKATTFQSRWGFHPCEYDLFAKLKSLHKWYWQSLYDFHQWHRCWRKEPQNRHGQEPTLCETFVEHKTWIKPVQVHGEDGYKILPKTVIDHGIVDLYQAARMPQVEPVSPFDAATRQQIEALYEKVKPSFD